MDVVSRLLQVLFMVLGFVMWVLPIAIAVWILLKISAMSRDMTLLKRQLATIAEHSGAPIVPQPPQPRGTHAPLWALGIVLAVFLVVMALLYAMPSTSSGPMDVQFESGESGGSSGSFSVPADELPPMPEPVPRTPGG